MVRRVLVVLAFVVTASLTACMSELAPISMPDAERTLVGAKIHDSSQQRMQGVYAVGMGNTLFGDSVTMKWVGGRAYFYSRTSVVFSECATAVANDSVHLEGYYRAVRGTTTGVLHLMILPSDGGRQIARNEPLTTPVVIQGRYYDPKASEDRRIELTFGRPLRNGHRFEVLGHRAGGRNSERLGRSENSITMAEFAEALGCTGIEIDIKRTKDNKLIVFHDETFSPRTVNSLYVLGPIGNYTLYQIQRHARLVNGERIPTLEEMLTAIIERTQLTSVWLDVKEPAATTLILEAQRNAIASAQLKDRKIDFYFGIATQEALQAYRASPLADSTPVLCELTADVALSLPSCAVWAPRWTNGLQPELVDQMHKQNKRVFTWTLDAPDYMTKFLSEGAFDGILTNYPSMLAGLAY